MPWRSQLILVAAAFVCLTAASKSTEWVSDETSAVASDSAEASGTFAPVGPPATPPTKTDAGESRMVDLVQSYTISGTLSGILEVSYRILVAGPCGSPPGTFDEEWLAHGTFVGTVRGIRADADLTYVGRVAAGGEVEGDIVLGHGLEGRLHVRGNFQNGELAYSGSLIEDAELEERH